MSDHNPITPLHLQTIEGYMARTSDSMTKLAESVNELVIAEKIRSERDERTQEEIKALKDYIKKHDDGIKFATWLKNMLNGYIAKYAFPFAMTGIILAVAYNYGLPLIKGGGG